MCYLHFLQVPLVVSSIVDEVLKQVLIRHEPLVQALPFREVLFFEIGHANTLLFALSIRRLSLTIIVLPLTSYIFIADD